MCYSFPEALDAVIADSALIRRATWVKETYIRAVRKVLVYVSGTLFVPSNEDLFATDWQIFGKGILPKEDQ